MAQLLLDIGVVFLVAGLFALLARTLKQPLIIGYLVAGLVIGPAGLGFIKSEEVIRSLSELGIAFLLFIVGLHLDFRKLKNLGKIILTVGLAQIIFTFIFTYFILLQFTFLASHAVYLAIALTLSSTIIVVKLLDEKKELNTVHGRTILGILLTQDIVALCALTFLSVGAFSVSTTFLALLKLVILIFLSVFFSLTFLPQAFKFFAKSQELLFVTSIMWFFAVMLGTQLLDLSLSIGAFLAGISLASIPYNLEIESKAVSLRDFFSTIFFVTIGMQITFANFEFWIIPIILFSLFVLIGNPLIIFISTLFLGLTARTAFLSSIALAQISEFSLVFIALAYQLKLVPHEILSFTALIALITFTVSTYLITYDGTLYLWFKPLLDKINHLTNQKDKKSHTPKNFLPEIILCGYGRVGKKIKQSLKNKKILIVEFDPEIINKLKKNIPVIYGDVGDDELLKNLPLKKVKMVISTIGDFYDTKRLIKHIKIFNKNIKIIVSAVESDDALQLYDFGADYVIVPHLIGGEYVSLLLHKGLNDVKHLFYKKQEHIDELRKV